MSHAYKAVGWNRQKRIYDLALVSGVVVYLLVFAVASLVLRPQITAETLLIRGFGTCALVLLHIVLAIGPLCRLDRRFLPLLYNRRHLGVTMFLAALTHAVLATVQFHVLGPLNPLVSILTSNGRYASLASFPFQPLGLAALVILFLMAATSHDFWLTNLTAPVWKALHMSVYVAYGLIVLHVAFGVLQAERAPLLAALLAAGFATIVGLHLQAALRARTTDKEPHRPAAKDGFVAVCRTEEIPEDRARVVTLGGERVAVFRYDGKISVLSNVCRHQNGPLGEGVVRDGCVTCPWHGFQYDPADGSSPPPFTETVPTFRVRVRDGVVLVHPRPNPAGTYVEPAECPDTTALRASQFYVGYVATAQSWVREFLRPRLLAVIGTALLLGICLVLLQQPFATSVYEYQQIKTWRGTVVEKPYPMLMVERPGRSLEEASPVSVFPLTVFGKRDAGPAVQDLHGRLVDLDAELIYRDGQTMLQIVDGTVRPQFGLGGTPPLEYIGEIERQGEIVDSKCYLGVMKPGREKPHRACASLCIRGGSPPMLLVETTDGGREHFLLVGEEGDAIGLELLDRVAEPVQITGHEYRLGDTRLLATRYERIERLP